MSIGLNADLGLSFQDKQMNLEISVKSPPILFARTSYMEDFSKDFCLIMSHHIVCNHMGVKGKYNLCFYFLPQYMENLKKIDTTADMDQI